MGHLRNVETGRVDALRSNHTVGRSPDADLYVGGTPKGHHLDGVLDFVRLARGTLADSKTTIEELYAWELDGPFLDDFTGQRRPADGGSAQRHVARAPKIAT